MSRLSLTAVTTTNVTIFDQFKVRLPESTSILGAHMHIQVSRARQPQLGHRERLPPSSTPPPSLPCPPRENRPPSPALWTVARAVARAETRMRRRGGAPPPAAAPQKGIRILAAMSSAATCRAGTYVACYAPA